jgi:hypothetical protein
MKEMYRVCKNGAKLDIVVPHPRHDDFMNDPTHVRPITLNVLALFSKTWNRKWEADGSANTKLALEHDVDFEPKTEALQLEAHINEAYEARPHHRRRLETADQGAQQHREGDPPNPGVREMKMSTEDMPLKANSGADPICMKQGYKKLDGGPERCRDETP